MLERALQGGRWYWGWLAFLGGFVLLGIICFIVQMQEGLRITGMGRDVSWGLYISQLTFLVGVAASAVILVLPYYLHNDKVFGRVTILGEFLAVTAIIMCLLFVIVDLGYPARLANLFMYPSPNSILFWDATVLSGYLVLNLLIGWNTLAAERKGIKPQWWVKALIYLSIPWAVSIHTVTAFLYAGLPGRHLWLTAVMAPRFLTSAFAAGPAILILLAAVMRRLSRFDAGSQVIRKLALIMTYTMLINLFLFIMELFTSFYSNIPSHLQPFVYLFAGLEGKGRLAPWMWISAFLGIVAMILLLIPAARRHQGILQVTCVIALVSLWIDKGLCLVIAGFIPNPLERVTEYTPTFPELAITLGIYSLGAVILTLLLKMAVSIKAETGT
jgi:molybdopterin-containing oxidoreductase family membrane subunit